MAELAERRARRAKLEEEAQALKAKAQRASKRSTRLKYEAEAKRKLAEAQSIKLRKRSSSKRKPKGVLATLGSLV